MRKRPSQTLPPLLPRRPQTRTPAEMLPVVGSPSPTTPRCTPFTATARRESHATPNIRTPMAECTLHRAGGAVRILATHPRAEDLHPTRTRISVPSSTPETFPRATMATTIMARTLSGINPSPSRLTLAPFRAMVEPSVVAHEPEASDKAANEAEIVDAAEMAVDAG